MASTQQDVFLTGATGFMGSSLAGNYCAGDIACARWSARL